MQPPIARQNGQSVWLYKRPLAAASQIFFSSATKTTSLLTLRWYRDPTLKSLCSWIWTSCSNQLAHLVIPCRYPVSSKKALREEQNFSAALLQMHAGIPCTLMTLTLSVCHAWGNPTLTLHSAGLNATTASVSVLASLRSRIAFFSESDSTSCAPPVFFLSGICEKKTVSRGFERAVTSELTLAQCPTCLAVTAEGESIRPSSSLNMIRVPPLWATWSRWVRVMQIRWQPFFLAAFSGYVWSI